MLRKLLSKSGRRILRAIKMLSTKSRRSKRSYLDQQEQQEQQYQNQQTTFWHGAIAEFDEASLSVSLPSLDAKSIDTYMTYVIESTDDCGSRCCHCDEYEENQRNENIENEMTI